MLSPQGAVSVFRRPLLKSEKWRTREGAHPQLFHFNDSTNPRYTSRVNRAHPPRSWMFKNAFWERSVTRQHLSDAQRQGVYEKEVLDPALLHSSLAIIQGSCEVSTLYPADIDLKAVVIEGWNLLSKMNLLGRTVWEIRAKSVLGVVEL
jgi:hypothetical protein